MAHTPNEAIEKLQRELDEIRAQRDAISSEWQKLKAEAQLPDIDEAMIEKALRRLSEKDQAALRRYQADTYDLARLVDKKPEKAKPAVPAFTPRHALRG